MHQLVYVFGNDAGEQLRKFSTQALHFHHWEVKDVLEHLRLRGKLNASMDMMEGLGNLGESLLFSLITDQVTDSTRVMILGDELDAEESELARRLNIGVIICLGADGTARWVSRRSWDGSRRDWWVTGGRWNGHLYPKLGVATAEQDVESICAESQTDEGRNVLKKFEIDFERMADEGRCDRSGLWKQVRGLVDSEMYMPMRECYRMEQDIDDGQVAMYDHPRSSPSILRKCATKEYLLCTGTMAALEVVGDWLGYPPDKTHQIIESDITKFSDKVDEIMGLELNQYLDLLRWRAYLPNSFVVGGVWRTQDSFLDFAGKDPYGYDRMKQWSEIFHEIYDQLPDDTMVTVADCHY